MPVLGTNWDYWKAILIAGGGTPLPGDTEQDLAAKVLALGPATGEPGDSMWDILRKITVAPLKSSSSINDLYRRYYKVRIGVDAPPGTSNNDLLKKIAESLTTGYPLTFLVNTQWYATDAGSGVLHVGIVGGSGSMPAGSDGYKVRYEVIPGGLTVSALQAPDDVFSHTFTVGNKVLIQVALFLGSTQVSDWSRAKVRTLG